MAIIPQTQSFKIFGAGADLGATTLTLQTFKNLDGTNLTMAHFGGTKGFLTIEPSSGTQEEQVSFASITNNANGTVTLGTIKTVLDYTPFTETAGLAKTHGGNVEVIVSNTSGFYNNIIDGATASQIVNVPAGNIAAITVQAAIDELDTEVLHKALNETATGIKTFTETAMPRITATHTYGVGEELFLTTKDYVDNVAGSAVVANASTTVKGIVEEATDAEVLASTTTGGTGARLYVNPGSVGNAANKIPFVTSTGKLDNSIMPNLKFGGTGADGALTQSSGVFNIDLGGAQIFVKNYTSISITGTGYITFTNPHANGTIIILKSQGNVTITSSATRAIDLRNLGATAGAGFVSGTFICGDGGRGAGALYIECAGAWNFTGTIDANGTNGLAYSGASTAVRGGGGGGGGGMLLALYNALTTNTGTINTNAGAIGASLTSGGIPSVNYGTIGTDSYATLGKIGGGTNGNSSQNPITTCLRFSTTNPIINKSIFICCGAGGGGGGSYDGSNPIVGGVGGGPSLSAGAGFSYVGLNTEFV